MEEPKEIRDITNPKNIRYRKVAVSSSPQVSSPDRSNKPKELLIEFSNPKDNEQPPIINLKVIEEDYYRRYKVESGIKSLLRAYDQSRKKNSSEGMSKLGLDIIKIKAFSGTTHNFSTGHVPSKKESKERPRDSLQKLELKYIQNKKLLSPLREPTTRKVDQENPKQQLKQLMEVATSLTDLDRPFQMTKGRSIFKRERRAEDYLYKRLEGSQKAGRQQQNVVYDRRIRSYLEFIWKNMYAHGIYQSLNLKHEQIAKHTKLKAYIAPGNNGAMVKGLLRRRFWWILVEQRTPDCEFVWTQLKMPEIFEKQERCTARHGKLKQEWDDDLPVKKARTTSKFRLSKIKESEAQSYNFKLLNAEDVASYAQWRTREPTRDKDKERDYDLWSEKVPKQLDQPKPATVIHNHLPQNFYLGNKKALFHNLKQYYGLKGEDVFTILPLTFHIRNGTKDPEYTRFLDFYRRRAKLCQKQQKKQQEEGLGQGKNKTRNIWIVKPGQNSNQGRGITVIDEIYELNNLLKPVKQTDKTTGKQSPEQTEHTYIVQLYIDRPFLYNNRKFDIRHYMLITNFYGILRAYWYSQGYIRTSSYEFDINNFQPEIHLTNDAVQKRFPDYHRYEPYNKLSYEEFQRYLDTTYQNKKYNFKGQILPKMKQMATDAAKSVCLKVSPGNRQHNFQIFGLDFMIDRHFEPWLIEINTNPCLQCACPLLNRIIPYMVEQSLKLSLDLAFPPPAHYPNTARHLAPLMSLQNFKYELILDSQLQSAALQQLYRKAKGNLIEQIGQIQDDEEFKDDGKQCKLDDFT